MLNVFVHVMQHLKLDPKNEKCLFRRGQSHMSMSGYDEAIKDFQQVLKLNPSNSAANQHIQTCREHLKAYEKQEKQLYAKIFAKMSKENEKVYLLNLNLIIFY